MNDEARLRADAFARTIPTHLKSDALLESVVGQLYLGGTFSEGAMKFIIDYRETATFPMTAEQFAQKMKEARSDN